MERTYNHWFPGPGFGKKKWKWSLSVVSHSLRPHGLYLPGSSIHGIFQSRLLEWVAISFSKRKLPTENMNKLFEALEIFCILIAVMIVLLCEFLKIHWFIYLHLNISFSQHWKKKKQNRKPWKQINK